MTIIVHPNSQMPPYLQIEQQIQGFIERAELGPGTPLPTVRQLAHDLGVAPNTVARAYSELQEEGWLKSYGRLGTVVADRPPSHDKRARARTLQADVDEFVISLLQRGFSKREIENALDRHVPTDSDHSS